MTTTPLNVAWMTATMTERMTASTHNSRPRRTWASRLSPRSACPMRVSSSPIWHLSSETGRSTRSPLWGSEGVLHKAVCLQKQRCAPALAPLPLAHALVTLFMFNSTHSSHLPPCPWHMPLSPCLCLTPLTPLTPLTLVHRFQFQLASSSFPASHSAIPSVPCSVVRACASFPTSRVPSSSI